MNGAHLHLLLTHIPVIGIIIGVVLLAYGLWRNQEAVQRVSLGLLVVGGIATIAVYLTGESAEELVEGVAGVSHDLIEAHESTATIALIAGIATGASALWALLWALFRERLARWTVLLTLVLGLATSGILAWTANQGGKINHPEIRSNTAQTTLQSPADHENEEE